MATGIPFNAIIQWPWLDAGGGADADLESFDIAGYGRPRVQLGYNQAEPGYFTAEFEVDPDTVPGTPIPMPLYAPSYSARIVYEGYDPAEHEATIGNRFWHFNAITLNFTR